MHTQASADNKLSLDDIEFMLEQLKAARGLGRCKERAREREHERGMMQTEHARKDKSVLVSSVCEMDR
jgi:hypothetical protein